MQEWRRKLKIRTALRSGQCLEECSNVNDSSLHSAPVARGIHAPGSIPGPSAWRSRLATSNHCPLPDRTVRYCTRVWGLSLSHGRCPMKFFNWKLYDSLSYIIRTVEDGPIVSQLAIGNQSGSGCIACLTRGGTVYCRRSSKISPVWL